jgi:hypothetical protein
MICGRVSRGSKQGVKDTVMCQEDLHMRKEEFVMGILIL